MGTWNEELCLDLPETPERLIEVIDTIKRLRSEADAEAEACSYDPVGYTAKRVAAMLAHADAMERVMEERLGWC